MTSPASALLIGGNGFIGKRLGALLSARGIPCVSVDRADLKKIISGHPPAGFPSCESVGWIFNLTRTREGAGDSIQAVRRIRELNPRALFISFGSITEFATSGRGVDYRTAKRISRDLLLSSGECDLYVMMGLVYGGNPRMDRDLHSLWPILRKSQAVLGGFRMSCIHVDEVCERVGDLLEWVDGRSLPRRPTEVRIPGESLTLAQLIERSVGLRRTMGSASVSALQRLALKSVAQLFYAASVMDQRYHRIAFFFELASLAGKPELQDSINHYRALEPSFGDEPAWRSGRTLIRPSRADGTDSLFLLREDG